jgi:hypothetical protein
VRRHRRIDLRACCLGRETARTMFCSCVARSRHSASLRSPVSVVWSMGLSRHPLRGRRLRGQTERNSTELVPFVLCSTKPLEAGSRLTWNRRISRQQAFVL